MARRLRRGNNQGLDQPVVVIPLKNNLEQGLNARDALNHHMIQRAVPPAAELPDVEGQALRRCHFIDAPLWSATGTM